MTAAMVKGALPRHALNRMDVAPTKAMMKGRVGRILGTCLVQLCVLAGCSGNASAQLSPAEKQMRRVAEILLDVHIKEGFLALPTGIDYGPSADECKDFLRAHFQLNLAERSSLLVDQKTFVQVRLELSEAELARVHAYAEKDATKIAHGS